MLIFFELYSLMHLHVGHLLKLMIEYNQQHALLMFFFLGVFFVKFVGNG